MGGHMVRRLTLMSAIVFFFFSLLLTLPALAKSRSSFETAPPPPEGMSLIYMYRIKVPPGLRTPKIIIDGEVISTLPNNSHTWFYLSPGTHTIKTKWGFMSDVPDIEFVANISPNQTHYLKMEGSVRSWGAGTTKVYTGIKEVMEGEALADLSGSKKYVPAEKQTASASPSSAPEVGSKSEFEKAPAPPEEYAVVYIYRPDSPPILRSPKIIVDGKETLKLSNKSYSWFYVRAGNHTIATEWGIFGGAQEKNISLTVENGKTYYLRAGGTKSSQGSYDSYHSTLDPVDENLAGRELKKITRYIPATPQTAE